MKIGLIGHGKMGRSITDLAEEQGLEITPVTHADVLIDFSHPTAVLKNVSLACSLKKPLVLGTTSWEKDFEEVKQKVNESNIGLIYAPNFSIAVIHFIQIAKLSAQLLEGFSPAIVETHDTTKVDAPSGLALKLQKEALKGAPAHSVRLPKAMPSHTIVFEGPYEKITLTHESKNRTNYAFGALAAARWIVNRQGFYKLEDML